MKNATGRSGSASIEASALRGRYGTRSDRHSVHAHYTGDVTYHSEGWSTQYTQPARLSRDEMCDPAPWDTCYVYTYNQQRKSGEAGGFLPLP